MHHVVCGSDTLVRPTLGLLVIRHTEFALSSKTETPGFFLCDTEIMALPDPKSVKVNLTTGTGVDIEWKDGHRSHYSFPFLRDACPCALCDDERGKAGRKPGEAPKLAPGALPMFKAAAKPSSAEPVGKYAIKFHWNDGHELGIYSWQFLRDVCPCEECERARATTSGKTN
ncbi:MAG: gamma-butyrobetaine hydroxylase-like domain-containing protein [Terriglobales bacterium]